MKKVKDEVKVEGEVEGSELVWVEFEPRPGQHIAFYPKYNTMGQLRAHAKAQMVAVALETLSSLEDFEAKLGSLADSFAVLVADWNLMDAYGAPLPKPTYGAAFDDFSLGADGETAWLLAELSRQFNSDPKS